MLFMKKKNLIYVLIGMVIALIALLGGILYLDSSVDDVNPIDLCGNGVCDDKELRNNVCSKDCESEEEFEQGVLYVGFMIHLEGRENQVTGEVSEEVFERWANAAEELATMLEEYGAKGTFEARSEFVLASEEYEDNILAELYNSGHGIGVHADKGGPDYIKNDYTQEEFTNDLLIMREDLERISGLDIRHVSGICSELDWVNAALDAGYEFTTGGVMMCGNSLSTESLVKADLTKKDLIENFHDPLPGSVEERIHIWRTDDSSDWLTSSDEGLAILSGDGGIEGLYENSYGTEGYYLESNDVDTYIEILEESLEHSSADEVNILYVALSIGNGMDDEDVAREWLEAIEPYVEEGKVEWKTLPEMYDEYLEVENGS